MTELSGGLNRRGNRITHYWFESPCGEEPFRPSRQQIKCLDLLESGMANYLLAQALAEPLTTMIRRHRQGTQQAKLLVRLYGDGPNYFRSRPDNQAILER